MSTRQDMRDALGKARDMVHQQEAEVFRRCRIIAESDDGMRSALASLETAKEMLETLRRVAHGPKKTQRAKPASKKSGKRPPGPSMPIAQDELLDAMRPGDRTTVGELFDAARAKYPGRFREDQRPGFASTFSKRLKLRSDFDVEKPRQSNAPWVYVKK